MADNDTDPPPPYSSVTLDSPPPFMAYEQVVYNSKYDVTQKTVPYYVQKDPAKVAAIIVTQHNVLHASSKKQGSCGRSAKCYGGLAGALLLLVLLGLAIWLGVCYGPKAHSVHSDSNCKGNDCNHEHDNSHEQEDDKGHHGGFNSPDTCSNSSILCDAIQACQQSNDETNCVRFGDGEVLQVKTAQDGRFLPVCYQGLDTSYANQICAQLGFRRSYASSPVKSTDSVALSLKLRTDSLIQGLVNVSSTCANEQVVSLQCTDCGKQQTTSRIIGGSASKLGQWPWQVSLHFNGRHVCGGSLISPDFVVSAAHCFQGTMTNTGSWRVYVGTISQNYLQIFSNVKKIIVNENYNGRSNDNDITLLKLDKPVDFSDTVQPVCLPGFDQNFSETSECWTSGFGTTEEGGDHASTNLMGVTVNIIDSRVCNSSRVYNGAISKNMLCSGDMNGGRDSCQGDSGGPLVCKGGNGRWYLVGITSWGAGCGERLRPGVYSKVTSLLPWIYSTMQQEKP
ncbi:transmembrane protease serine 13-like isoform X2 [Myxocyprinus asiaticus]|uniref:transmembrane protease serine 13-like isoform X2 n=1 Tax=Myxocyprinus asiaticus TaxID=70543 RepID=UPI00222308A0|nr:transmembrane protease serine 13-like isoform X2 [Myxocyprinus asiaticus]